MSNGNFSDTKVNGWLEEIRAGEGVWVSLHRDHPIQAGAYLSEFSGGGYVRDLATFGVVSNRTVWITSALLWSGLVADTVAYIAGWNAETGGDLTWWSQVAVPKLITDGQGYTLAANTIALSL